LAKSDSRGDGEAAEIELTYSTTGGISRAKPALGTLKLCIIQVSQLQKQIDGLSKRFRELDTLIQELNWKTDLI
jgi:hypothetical protein